MSKLIASRGILELTDRRLCFQVSSLDASFGMKNVSIDLCTITGVAIEGGDIHPRVIVSSEDRRYEFVLSKGQELYDRLRDIVRDPLGCGAAGSPAGCSLETCGDCGKSVSKLYRYCPWCGSTLKIA